MLLLLLVALFQFPQLCRFAEAYFSFFIFIFIFKPRLSCFLVVPC